MASQRKSVYEQLRDPHANSNPIFNHRSSNLLYKDESIISSNDEAQYKLLYINVCMHSIGKPQKKCFF